MYCFAYRWLSRTTKKLRKRKHRSIKAAHPRQLFSNQRTTQGIVYRSMRLIIPELQIRGRGRDLNLSFIRVWKQGKINCTFFTRKVSIVIFIEGCKPSRDCKMILLLTYDSVAKPSCRIPKYIVFSRQNDSGSRAHYLVLRKSCPHLRI